MFIEPITLAMTAGVVSLAAGFLKRVMDHAKTKLASRTEVTIRNGDKKIVVSGLSDEEIKKVLDNFRAEVGTEQEAAPKTPAM